MRLPNLFETLPVNERGRDFIVGDLHGQKAMLDRALDLVAFDRDVDRLIALGDLIDRGPDSETILRYVDDEPWFYSLQGNHEAMLAESFELYYVWNIWSRNGTEWTRNLPEGHLKTLAAIVEGMPLAIELPLPDGTRWGLVHAEVPVESTWDDVRLVQRSVEASIDDACSTVNSTLIWGRRRIHAWAYHQRPRLLKRAQAAPQVRAWDAAQPVLGIDRVIAGHTVLATRRPAALSNHLFIETGAYENEGRLTIVEPAKLQYWQVSRRGTRVRALRCSPTALPEARPLDESLRPTEQMRSEAEVPAVDFSLLGVMP